MSVLVRLAVAADVAAIVALASESAEIGQWTEAQYLDTIVNPEEFVTRRLWVAEIDECVVGFLAAMHVDGENAAELENVLAMPRMRRQGVAHALCDALLQWTRELGAEAMALEVRESNTVAIAFYESLGFGAVGKRKDYYSNPAEDAVMMRRQLVQVR